MNVKTHRPAIAHGHGTEIEVARAEGKRTAFCHAFIIYGTDGKMFAGVERKNISGGTCDVQGIRRAAAIGGAAPVASVSTQLNKLPVSSGVSAPTLVFAQRVPDGKPRSIYSCPDDVPVTLSTNTLHSCWPRIPQDTVIVQEPSLTAVTTPSLFTVAIAESLVVHVIAERSASAGA